MEYTANIDFLHWPSYVDSYQQQPLGYDETMQFLNPSLRELGLKLSSNEKEKPATGIDISGKVCVADMEEHPNNHFCQANSPPSKEGTLTTWFIKNPKSEIGRRAITPVQKFKIHPHLDSIYQVTIEFDSTENVKIPPQNEVLGTLIFVLTSNTGSFIYGWSSEIQFSLFKVRVENFDLEIKTANGVL